MKRTTIDTGPPASPEPHDWAVILAGGQGRRMAHVTMTDDGQSVPKQFCSLGRGSSLVHETLRRAGAVAPPERTLVTVTECHAAWWQNLRDALPADNLLVQPEQRGTGIGILQPLLEVLRRDPVASLVILPADHYFGSEASIARGLQTAMKLTRRFPRQVLLLGFAPEESDPDLGYIVPGAAQGDDVFAVSRFIEKPGPDRVGAFIDDGALWNSFIVAADAHALLELFERHCPDVVAGLRQFTAAPLAAAARRLELARLFREIPSIDFSQDVATTGVGNLRVLRLPRCGWNDLGTPARLERVLRHHRSAIDRRPPAPGATRGHVDLAARCRVGQDFASKSSSRRS